MNVLRIVAPTTDDLMTALSSAGATVTDPIDPKIETPRWDDEVQVVLLPPLCKTTGNTLTDEDGNEFPESICLPGCHANVYTEDPGIIAALEPITVYPETPLVKLAGVE